MPEPLRPGDPGTPPVVLSVAFPYAAIGPHAVGGAEVICSQLEAALPALGFRSVVVAHADSKPAGVLYGTVIPPGTITDKTRSVVEAAHQRNLDRACREHRVALVHMHGLDFARYHIPEELPVLVTLHLPLPWYGSEIWDLPDRYHLVCVSEHQRSGCPAHARQRVAVIGNGVPLPDPATLRPAGRYALMMARICPEKNLHVGLDAARRAQMPAVLAGDIFPYEAHQRYFADEVQPRLTRLTGEHEGHSASPQAPLQARFVGPVSGAEKDRLLRRAACLLLPSLAPETSSLVAMEALAAGVPVIAMAVGAVPEIVEAGRSGFLITPGADATERMAEAIGRLPEIDRDTCRTIAEERFPLATMVHLYLERYRELGRQAVLAPASVVPAQAAQDITVALVVERLETGAALQVLSPEWAALWRQDRRATPFQHPAWLLPWWRQFGPDGRLCAVTVRGAESRALQALLPTYSYTDPVSHSRQLLFAGAGTTDYMDAVWSAHSPAAEAIAGLSALLKERGSTWDVSGLCQLRAESPLIQAAQTCGLVSAPSEPTSSIRMERDLPSKIRVNLNRYRRLAATRGTMHCALATEPGDALAWFDRLAALHGKRWRSRGEDGVLADGRVLAHHREALPLLLEAGLLRLFHLTLAFKDVPHGSVAHETLGVLYGLADGPEAEERRLYLYLIGFDDRFAELSPGSLLLQEAWLHARAHGFARVDLLRGGEAYKKLWGAETEQTFALSLRSSGMD